MRLMSAAMKKNVSLTTLTLASIVVAAIVVRSAPQNQKSANGKSTTARPKAVLQPTKFTTQTRDFTIYSVPKNGKGEPRLIVRVDYFKYPGKISFRSIATKGVATSPEENLARYFHAWNNKKASYAEFRSLYHNSSRRMTEKDVRELFDSLTTSRPIKDVFLQDRFDVGSLSFVTGDVVYPPKSDLFFPETYSTTKQIGGRSYAADHGILDVKPVTAAITLADGETVDKVVPSQSKTEWKLPYSVQIPSLEPDDPADLHPIHILFDGKPMNYRVEQTATKSTDPILLFTHKFFQTYRIGTQKQWLDMWTEADVSEWWNVIIKDNPDQYKEERNRFRGDQWRVFFVMDLGKNAIVFLEDRETLGEPSINQVYLLKTKSGYRLTQGAETPDGEQMFSGNLQQILTSQPFETFLRGIAKQTMPAKPAAP